MYRFLFPLLVILPIVSYAEDYRDYLLELDNLCPFEYSTGKITSVKEINKTVIIKYCLENEQAINAIKKLDSDKNTQDIVRDYFTNNFLELFEGYPYFYSSYSIGVSKMTFKFENSRSKVLYEIPIERSRFMWNCHEASKEGILPTKMVSNINLKFFSLFENTLGPNEVVPGYKRTKVNYDEKKNRLEYICVFDEGKLRQTLPKTISNKDKDDIKEMWFGKNSTFMEALYPTTIKYLERLEGSFAVIIKGSISKNQIIIDVPYDELKMFAINYRISLLQ